MEYYSLKEEIREVLNFQNFCTLEIQNPFRDLQCGENIKTITHMVDEVCKEVGTRWLPPGTKREDSSKPYACPSSRRMFSFS